MLAGSGHQWGKVKLPCLRCVLFPRKGVGKEREESGGGKGIRCRDSWAWAVEGKRPGGSPCHWETNWSSRTWLGTEMQPCLQNAVECNSSPSLPQFIKVCSFNRFFVWIGFLSFGRGWWWWCRGWSSMETFEGTHVEAEITLGEAGVRSQNWHWGCQSYSYPTLEIHRHLKEIFNKARSQGF